MNYRNIGVREIQNLASEYPSYSLGEVLYAALRAMKMKSISELLNKTDEEIFTSINKAIETEKEIA